MPFRISLHVAYQRARLVVARHRRHLHTANTVSFAFVQIVYYLDFRHCPQQHDGLVDAYLPAGPDCGTRHFKFFHATHRYSLVSAYIRLPRLQCLLRRRLVRRQPERLVACLPDHIVDGGHATHRQDVVVFTSEAAPVGKHHDSHILLRHSTGL